MSNDKYCIKMFQIKDGFYSVVISDIHVYTVLYLHTMQQM